MLGNLLAGMLGGIGVMWDLFSSNLHKGYRGFSEGRRGRKFVQRTRNVRKLEGKRRLDGDGIPYGVPGAKMARKAFEGRLTMKSGTNHMPMLHARQK